MSEASNFVLAASWIDLLTPEQQIRVRRSTVIERFAAGTIIERKGDWARAWLGVLDGLVKISVGSSDGRLVSFTGIPPGGWVGEGSLVKRERRKYDVIALRESVVARVPDDTFQWLLDISIPFNRFVLVQMNERLAQFIGRSEYRLLEPDARVARHLAELFNPLLYPGTGLRLAITQEELGYLAGVSRQRANRALRKLEDAGVLTVSYGAIDVRDLERLKHFGETTPDNAQQ